MNKRIKVIIFLLILELCLFSYGVLWYPYAPNVISGYSLDSPSLSHWMGLDNLGVDIYAQVSLGYFNSISIGLVTVVVTLLLGGVMGIISGYFQGWIDDLISFVINVFLAIPQLPVMIVLGAFFGQRLFNIIIIVAMFSWARIAKVVRAKTLSIRGRDYITQGELYGAVFFHMFFFHLRDEVIPILVINSIGVIGRAIIQESSLAYLGLCDPTSRSWGLMISKVLDFQNIYYTEYWKWWLMAPLLSLVITILLFRMFARELENHWLDEEKAGARRRVK